jgi:hypothetical protein
MPPVVLHACHTQYLARHAFLATVAVTSCAHHCCCQFTAAVQVHTVGNLAALCSVHSRSSTLLQVSLLLLCCQHGMLVVPCLCQQVRKPTALLTCCSVAFMTELFSCKSAITAAAAAAAAVLYGGGVLPVPAG